jgi:hypothetical protein
MAKRIDIKVSLIWPRDKIMSQVRKAAKRAIDGTVIETQARLMDKLSEYGTGRVYKRKGDFHRASRKGRPPAADTGMLRLSWTVGMRVEKRDFSTMVTSNLQQGTNFGSALKYAPILESKKGLDRPYLAPTVREMKRERVLQKHLVVALQRAVSVINAGVK